MRTCSHIDTHTCTQLGIISVIFKRRLALEKSETLLHDGKGAHFILKDIVASRGGFYTMGSEVLLSRKMDKMILLAPNPNPCLISLLPHISLSLDSG